MLLVLWELTDSNGEAEAGIPLKINIIYSRNRNINSNFVNSRNKWRERAKASCFLLNGEEKSFSDTYRQKKRLDNSNLSPFPCGS